MDPVLKYPGAKWRLAKWIVSHLPKHTTYLEPFFGSGAVFFNKIPSHVETINDLDGQVVNLFRVMRERAEELAALVEMTPWSRKDYYASYEPAEDPLEDARRFLVRMWQAYGAMSAHRTGWRSDVQGRQNTSCARVWRQLPARILAVADRLKDAQIEHRPALEVIEAYRYPDVLIYADPPYSLDTRSGRIYRHEMTDADHLDLLDALDKHPGPVLLSGYACTLYDDRLQHWGRKTARAIAEGGRERQEVLWLNPVAAERLGGQQRMEFGGAQ